MGTHSRRISAQMVHRRLAAIRLFARRPYKGAILTGRHHANRLAWANNHRGWGRQPCRQVLFTEESKFNLSFADGNKRIYRRRGKRFAQCCVLEYNRWGGGGIMVWAGVSADHDANAFCARSSKCSGIPVYHLAAAGGSFHGSTWFAAVSAR